MKRTSYRSVLSVAPTRTSYQAAFETYELMDGEPPYTTFGSGLIRFL